VSPGLLSEEQRDALQEITNVGMGQAAASIAAILGEFVQLSVPRILILRPALIGPALARMVGPGPVSAVRQGFHGELRGEVLIIYGADHCRELAGLMGYDTALDEATERELLLDVSNVLAGACLGGIAAQLKTEIGFSPPSLMADRAPVSELLSGAAIATPCALFVEVNFRLERRAFASHLVLLMPEEELLVIRAALDRFLESL
jgi:chemotaxis protein CheC